MKHLILFLLLSTQLFSAELKPIDCSYELGSYVTKMLQVDEIRDVVTTVQSEGPLKIIVNQHKLSDQFGAFWDMDQRIICVSLSKRVSDGEVIGSILFELHNALANKKLNNLDELAAQGKIDRETYVRSVEYIEYENSKKAARIATMGIERGLLPKDACLFTYKDFDEHYHYQKVGGHSAWISKNYDQIQNSKVKIQN